LSHLEPIALIAKAAAAALAAELELRVGDELVARVAALPGPDGRGLLSLAGTLHSARLPTGLREGQKLRLQVAGAEEGALVLRLLGEEASSASPTRVAGALAVRGDGELLRAALGLAGAGGALALPDGSSARVAFDDESPEREQSGADAPCEASVLLHSPALGPIEVRVRLDAAGVSAVVGVEPGRAAEIAEQGAPALAAALERAASRPAVVAVAPRQADEKRPDPPRPTDVFDAYA
jgi:flagellar hook-length control protein FliK